MMPNLTLQVPGLRDMAYRQGILADPETMSYNAGQPVDAPGYDVATGCIQFPMSDWRYWREVWLWHEPNCFSAYLRDEDLNAFVGEACYYYDMEADMHAVGILIEASRRGRGYGTAGLKLLAKHAFRLPEIDVLFADIPLARENAVRMFLGAGFKEVWLQGGICRFELRRVLP